MRDAHRCLDGERRGRKRTSGNFLPHERSVSWIQKKKTSEKSPPASLDFRDREQNFSWLAILAMAIFSGLCKSVSSALRKRMEYCWFEERKWRFCSLYIEDALPSTSRCTCRLNNVHTYQQHIYNIPVTCFFRGPLSQIQCSTSHLAASCCITPGGTGTLNAHKRGARHHAVPHGRRHMLVLPMQVNERL